jgi:SprT-like protein
MTDDLNTRVQFYVKKVWDLDNHPEIKINTRLRTTHGCYVTYHNKEGYIELSQMTLNQNDYVLTDILLHELCHWYCHISGLDDKDGHRDFENELNRIGSTSSECSIIKNKEILYMKAAMEYLNDIDLSNITDRYIEYIPTKNVKRLVDLYNNIVNKVAS